MKKFFLMLLILILISSLLVACSGQNAQYIRIHIRANSENLADQEIKLTVKDAIINFLAPLANLAKNKKEMMVYIDNNIENIKTEAERVLFMNNFDYAVDVRLGRENFPTKTYGELTLESGEYDALIINLGTGTGSNWWCVAFPPLCFIPAEEVKEEKIVYKSKIKEWITKIFNPM